MEYWEKDFEKVKEFNFLNEKVKEFISRWSQSLVNIRSPGYLKQKNIWLLFTRCKRFMLLDFSLEHGDVLLVRVKFMVKSIHICIKFLMYDKSIW